MAAKEAKISIAASGSLVSGPESGEGSAGSGTKRTRSKNDDDNKASKNASLTCDKRFRSSMQKSLALLPVLGMTRLDLGIAEVETIEVYSHRIGFPS